MMFSFQYGTTTFDYSIEYLEHKKDVSISISLNEGIKLRAPHGIDPATIQTILYKKAPWIIKKKYDLDEILEPAVAKEFVSGEKFPYLGRHYRLKVHKIENIHNSTLNFKQGRFIAEVPEHMAVQEKTNELKLLFREWYISHGYKKIEERMNLYCPKMELQPSKVVLKEQKMRWGSCTPDGNIYLNWQIMTAPMSIVDYVLVHELAHLKYLDHSTDYWRFVRSILPDYEQRKEWLRVNGPTLTI